MMSSRIGTNHFRVFILLFLLQQIQIITTENLTITNVAVTNNGITVISTTPTILIPINVKPLNVTTTNVTPANVISTNLTPTNVATTNVIATTVIPTIVTPTNETATNATLTTVNSTNVPSITVPSTNLSEPIITTTTESYQSFAISFINHLETVVTDELTSAAYIYNKISHNGDVEEVSTISPLCKIERITNEGKGKSFSIVEGDFYVTFMMTTNAGIIAEYLVTRINSIGIIPMNATLGLRSIEIDDFGEVIETYLQETQFHQECLTDSLGIFVTPIIWDSIKPLATNKTWVLPSVDEILFPRIAHILYELPWDNRNISIEIRTKSTKETNKFVEAAKKEHLCFQTYSYNDENIYLVLGNEMLTAEHLSGTEGGIVFAAPIGNINFNTDYIKNLGNKSYIFSETKIDFNYSRQNVITNQENKDTQVLSSDFLIIASAIVDMTNWLNNSINRFCNEEELTAMTCSNPMQDLYNWEKFRLKKNPHELLQELKLEIFEESMNYNLLQLNYIPTTDNIQIIELKNIAELNFITHITTFFHYPNDNDNKSEATKLGHSFLCNNKTINITQQNALEHDENDFEKMHWHIKQEAWIVAGLTVSTLGILISLAILIFVIVRICMEDVLEGNPVSTLLLLISIIIMFASFIPFSIEYTGEKTFLDADGKTLDTWNSLCAIQLFLVTLCYCMTFSLLLCRAIMLASIGSEGGFLSHVNGYIQSIICIFSILVQIGLSTQLLIIMHATHKSVSCHNIFYGNWFWGLIAYDGCLLAILIVASPLYFRSQRNYREGILILTGSILAAGVWSVWIPISLLDHDFRLISVPLGLQATAVVILCGILIPRSFLIVRGIARSDLAQNLPSLTTLAFAQANNQFASEQSIYECVNPAMRQRNNHHADGGDDDDDDDDDHDNYPSISEIPTLPLRGSSRGNNHNHIYYSQQQHQQQQQQPYQQTLPISPSKMTRF